MMPYNVICAKIVVDFNRCIYYINSLYLAPYIKLSITKRWQNLVIIRETQIWRLGDKVQTLESPGLITVESCEIRKRNWFTSWSPLWNSLNLGCNLEKKNFRVILKLLCKPRPNALGLSFHRKKRWLSFLCNKAKSLHNFRKFWNTLTLLPGSFISTLGMRLESVQCSSKPLVHGLCASFMLSVHMGGC